MRNDHIKGTYRRADTLPETGRLEDPNLREEIIRDSIIAAGDCLAMYAQGSSSKPGTIPHELALTILDIVQRFSNPNGVDREMFRGAANREKDVIAMTSRLFGKGDRDQPTAGYLLSGGTESLNQVSYMLRNQYFAEVLHENVRIKGISQALFDASKETGNQGKILRPRVLLPVNYHFAGIKGTDLLGIGRDNLAVYGLNSTFDIDERSLEDTVRGVYEEGDDIMYTLAVGGDTTRGKVHDIRKLSEITRGLAEEYGKRSPPIVIDAAGSYLFIGVMHDNPNYDGKLPEVSFAIPGVVAIVGDPHKQPMPYSCGLLMLKDGKLAKYADMRCIANCYYLDMDDQESADTTAALATIPTSRSGSHAFAVWAYMVYQGKSGLRQEKERIWGLVKDLSAWVKQSSHYELVSEPQTQVVPFRFKGSGEENRMIYKRIKEGEGDYCYISHDTDMLVRTKQEQDESNPENTGLFATIMEHNTPEHLQRLEGRLAEEAQHQRRRR